MTVIVSGSAMLRSDGAGWLPSLRLSTFVGRGLYGYSEIRSLLPKRLTRGEAARRESLVNGRLAPVTRTKLSQTTLSTVKDQFATQMARSIGRIFESRQ